MTSIRDVALIDLPKEEMMVFFEKHNAYKSASEATRAALLLDCLIYTYTKCGYKLTKSIIDKEMTDNIMARHMVMFRVMAAAEAQ